MRFFPALLMMLAAEPVFADFPHPCREEIREHCSGIRFEPRDGESTLQVLSCLTDHFGPFGDDRNRLASSECGDYRKRKAGQFDAFGAACSKDRNRLCPNEVSFDCLKANEKKLSPACRKAYLRFVTL